MRENTRVTLVKPFCSYDLISQEDNSPPQAEMSPSKLKPDLREDEPRLPAAVFIPAPVKG